MDHEEVRVFVSGCYDILHAGHVQFFREARALGTHLTVSIAGADVLRQHKQRRSSLPDDHKRALVASLACVDAVVVTHCTAELGLDFAADFRRIRPQILAVTTDDQYSAQKRELCEEVGARYVVLPKTPPQFTPVSTTGIVAWIRAPDTVPLRVDFAGGWLDVPRHARTGAFIVNCAISPLVSNHDWPYERNAGLGGSAAWALLSGKDALSSELELGVGWQDPAIIRETGLCVWRSGPRPVLEIKTDAGILAGRMALLWTGAQHCTPSLADREKRDYAAIERAGKAARDAVWQRSFEGLADAVRMSYRAQVMEGMDCLPEDVSGAVAFKYCGGGFGGYALYLFSSVAERDSACNTRDKFRPIEPFVNSQL